MRWYWRLLINLALVVPVSIAFGFLQALFEVPVLADAQTAVLAAKYWLFAALSFWVMGLFR